MMGLTRTRARSVFYIMDQKDKTKQLCYPDCVCMFFIFPQQQTTQVYDPCGVVRIVFGPETEANEKFIADVSRSLQMICERGMMYTLLHTK